LCDALLGALALGDIGQHFPDTDPAYRDADSRELLRSVFDLIKTGGFELGNADITIIAEKPRVLNYSEPMRSALAADMEASLSQVSIKATTTEKAGFLGREEGIAAQAVVLLLRVTS
jgi:2-C-methyl-D-erythritol 2,4-cyclodiphosphate synthase